MTYPELWRRLLSVYDESEAKAIAKMLLEVRFGLSPADVYMGKVTQLSQEAQDELYKMAQRIEVGEPVQYVLGKADFAGRTFHVTPDVLIPRPETEELCQWVISYTNAILCSESKISTSKDNEQNSATTNSHSLLDIGTGSGCIAITLALELPCMQVSAWDISETALATAQNNADMLGADVHFVQQDALNTTATYNRWDIIVSNPPYICYEEARQMERNVLQFEPHKALFVPDNDPLLFYRAIALYAKTALKTNGNLFFEINSLYADNMQTMLHQMGWSDVEMRKDAFGKMRMVRARKD